MFFQFLLLPRAAKQWVKEDKKRSVHQKHQGAGSNTSIRSFAKGRMIMRARRWAAAMALACLLCLLVAPLLAAQGDWPSRKLLSKAEQEKPTSHGGIGNHGAGTTATPEEPCSSGTGSSGSRGSAGTGEAKWAEIHTDYIYTQDVKNP